MWIALALITSLAIDPGVTCPRVDDLQAAVARLAPAAASPAERVVHVGGDDATLVLTLRDGVGALVARKELPRAGASCAELTDAAAVVIATWQRPADEWLPEIPRLTTPTPLGTLQRERAPRTRLRYEVAAAALLSIANDGALAAGAEASLAIGPARSRWAGRLSLIGDDFRSVALGFGRASWTRAALALGPTLRFGSVWRIDLQADAVLALLVLRGDRASGATAFNADPGLRGGVRLSRAWGAFAPFVNASALGWLRVETVQTAAAEGRVVLPHFEVLLAAGADFAK